MLEHVATVSMTLIIIMVLRKPLCFMRRGAVLLGCKHCRGRNLHFDRAANKKRKMVSRNVEAISCGIRGINALRPILYESREIFLGGGSA